MTLALRSTIDVEIAWALDRLCRLCLNEQFLLRNIPGLIDALFEWPEWYVTEGYKELADVQPLFSTPRLLLRRHRHALECLFVLRNVALHDTNAQELAYHSHTMPLIINALRNLDPDLDENAEFVLHILDFFHALGSKYIIYSLAPAASPLPPLMQVASQSSNRSLIISALTMITLIFSDPKNAGHLSADSPALNASLRYLPLFIDGPLLDACLNYLYVHLSHGPMAIAFLLHPDLPATLKLLVSLLLSEQVEETVTLDVTGTVHTTPSASLLPRDHELTQEELSGLLEQSEPERCFTWYCPSRDKLRLVLTTHEG